MIAHLLQNLVSKRFAEEEHYREGHLRVVNALPGRKVQGLHIPDMKKIATAISRNGVTARLHNGTEVSCGNGAEVIKHFEQEPLETLTHEEIIIWGFLLNRDKRPFAEKSAMLARYIPAIDNWAVCDTFCSNALWLKRSDKNELWSFLLPYFSSTQEFEVRFAVVTSMCCLLCEEWLPTLFAQLDKIEYQEIKSKYTTCKKKPERPQQGTVQGAEPYYVRMAVAWLLATALAKYPAHTRAYLRKCRQPEDVIKMYTRKAKDSFRTRNVAAL